MFLFDLSPLHFVIFAFDDGSFWPNAKSKVSQLG